MRQQVQGGVEDPVLGVTEPQQLLGVTQGAGRPRQRELQPAFWGAGVSGQLTVLSADPCWLFNRPGVAGAVLQTPPLLIN